MIEEDVEHGGDHERHRDAMTLNCFIETHWIKALLEHDGPPPCIHVGRTKHEAAWEIGDTAKNRISSGSCQPVRMSWSSLTAVGVP